MHICLIIDTERVCLFDQIGTAVALQCAMWQLKAKIKLLAVAHGQRSHSF